MATARPLGKSGSNTLKKNPSKNATSSAYLFYIFLRIAHGDGKLLMKAGPLLLSKFLRTHNFTLIEERQWN
jgi:hypothetical protein